jgi:hypothetical protein
MLVVNLAGSSLTGSLPWGSPRFELAEAGVALDAFCDPPLHAVSATAATMTAMVAAMNLYFLITSPPGRSSLPGGGSTGAE